MIVCGLVISVISCPAVLQYKNEYILIKIIDNGFGVRQKQRHPQRRR